MNIWFKPHLPLNETHLSLALTRCHFIYIERHMLIEAQSTVHGSSYTEEMFSVNVAWNGWNYAFWAM